MRLTVVGCGTVIPEPDRACSSYYLEHGATRILIDCGPGAVQALARLAVPWQGLTHLCISHFHADHIGALPGLFFALRHGVQPPRTGAPLEVFGPAGTRALFRGLAEALGDFMHDPGFPVTVTDLAPGAEAAAGEIVVSVRSVPHTPESMALRFEADGWRLVYTGDTGPDEGLIEFARAAHLLIAECSLPDSLVGDNHLSPSRVARLARRSGAARLLATHVYPQFRAAADVIGLIGDAGFSGPAELAFEGLEIGVGEPFVPSR